MNRILFLLFLLLQQLCSAQYKVSGIVQDQDTHEALAFVNLITPDGKHGTSTDIEGRFTLMSDEPVMHILVSYVGYQKLNYPVNPGLNKQVIYLARNDIQLAEFEVYPGINPADILMEKVLERKKINNPEKNINFSYNSYNKMFITMSVDSELIKHPERIAQLDSNNQKALAFFDKQYLFLAESVTERQFIVPDKNKETVLASKVSGFQNPIFTLLATELQSFTFYKDFVSLGGILYEGPLTKNATNKYFFLLEDTLYDGKDSIFILSFRPKRGKDFKGMQGTLGIHTNGYALKTVIAEPAEKDTLGLSLKVQQKYELVADHWFPVQLNTILFFNMIKVNNFSAIGIANGYLKDIKINPELSKKDFNAVDLRMNDDAANRDENYWNQYRTDSLTEKERKTYHVVDSISKANKFEKKMNAITYLMDGQIPVGPIGIDIPRLMRYNDYEGFRLGLGLHTNDKISKYASLGGYFAYGFKDKAFKYGGDLSVHLRKKDAGLSVALTHDLTDAGGINYLQPLNTLSNDLSDLYLNRFDWSDKLEGEIHLRFLNHFKGYLFGNIQQRKSFSNYQLALPDNDQVTLYYHNYNITEIGGVLRFQYREKFIEGKNKLISKGSDFPVLLIKYTQGLKDIYQGQFNYQRIDARLEKRHRIRGKGYVYYRIDAGWINGNLPYGLLYNPRGTWRSMQKGINVFSGGGFEVMRTNEFLTNQYFAYHLRYDFRTFIKKGKFKPELSLVSNGYFGKLSHPEYHQNITFTIPDKGYYESGLMINQLIRSNISGIGVGAFYRYGPYQLPKNIDNFAFKLTFTLSLF